METVTYRVEFNPLSDLFCVHDVDAEYTGGAMLIAGELTLGHSLTYLRRDIRKLERYQVACIELDHSVALCPGHDALERLAREVNDMHASLVD